MDQASSSMTSMALDMLCFTKETQYIFDMGYLVVAISGFRDAICIFDVKTDCFIENGIGNIGFTNKSAEKFLWQRLGRKLQKKYLELLAESKTNEMSQAPKKPLEIIKEAIKLCGYIYQLTANPFLESGFNIIDEKDVVYNTVRKSKYYKEVKPVEASGLAKLSLRALVHNDEMIYGGFSFSEIILAWSMFHTEKIMAVLCLCGEERGLGKTTLLTLGDMLYVDNTVEVVNTGDSQLLQWGDIRDGKRTIIYDDVPNDARVISTLSKQLKSDATQFSRKTINIKGGGVKQTNALNQGITTNFTRAVPLDETDDRRIYPIHINSTCYTKEELSLLAQVPVLSKDLQGNSYIQSMLNHFYYVYISTREMSALKHLLNKRVPLNEFKEQVARQKAPLQQLFVQIIENSETYEGMLMSLHEHILQGDDTISLLFFNEQQFVNIYEVKNVYYILFSTLAMQHLARLFDDMSKFDKSGNSIARRLFPDFSHQQYKCGNKNIRGIRIMLKNWRG